jgi:cytochrome c biogenesis protein CcmG/thiol:disulfide interchange protein DsbE
MTEEKKIEQQGVALWAQIVIWLFVLGLLALVAYGLYRARNPMVEVGSVIPDFDLAYYEGYEYQGKPQMKLSDFRGKVVVLNIWASWCKPCEQEAPDLEEAWQFYKDGGEVVFVGVAYVDTAAGSKQYLQKFDITFPNAPDLQSKISSTFNLKMGVPETYIIDREGLLRHVKIGPFASANEIKAVIEGIK